MSPFMNLSEKNLPFDSTNTTLVQTHPIPLHSPIPLSSSLNKKEVGVKKMIYCGAVPF